MKVVISTGAPFWSTHLAAGLAREGHDCTLLLGGAGIGKGEFAVRCLRLTQTLERVLCAAMPGHRGAVQYAVRRIFDRWAAAQVRQLSADLVIGWSSWSRQTLAQAADMGAATALERGSTHIDAQQELLNEEFRHWGIREEPVDRRIRALELQEYRQVDWITVPSSFAKASFEKHLCPAYRLEIVPFGVDTGQFQPLPGRDTRFRALFVGLVDLRKGVPYLLRAYERVRRSDTDLLLVGPLSRTMRRLTREFAVPYRHVGAVGRAAVATLMARASVLVVPSIEEGLARVVLEAMACGTPVIATTSTGASDVITEGVDGFIVAPRDVDALAGRLRFLRDHPDCAAAMGASGRRKVEHGFTWEHYGRRVAEVVRRRLGV